MDKKIIVVFLAAVFVFGATQSALAVTLSESQQAALQNFLKSFGSVLGASTSDDYGTGVTATPGIYCPTLSVTMQRGSRDSATNGQVTELQLFLADYFGLNEEDLVTGYFGKLTLQYVQKFQVKQNLPSLGIAGSLTRAAIAKACGTGVGGTTPAPASDPLELKRSEVNRAIQSLEAPVYIEMARLIQNIRSSVSLNVPKARSFNQQWGDRILIMNADVQAILQKKITTLNLTELSDLSAKLLKIIADRDSVLSAYNTIPMAELTLIHQGPTTPAVMPSVAPSISVTSVNGLSITVSYVNIPQSVVSPYITIEKNDGSGTDIKTFITMPYGTGTWTISMPETAPSGSYFLRVYAVGGTASGAPVAESAPFTFTAVSVSIPASASILSSTLNPTSNSFTLSGTATGATRLYIYVVPSTYSGATDFISVSALNGTSGVFSNSTYLSSGGAWYFALGGLSGGTYKVLVYDYSSAINTLLTSGALTVPSTQTLPTASTNAFDPASLTSSTGKPTITGSAIVAPVCIAINTPQGVYTSGSVYTSGNRFTYTFSPPTPIPKGQYLMTLVQCQYGFNLVTSTITINQP